MNLIIDLGVTTFIALEATAVQPGKGQLVSMGIKNYRDSRDDLHFLNAACEDDMGELRETRRV